MIGREDAQEWTDALGQTMSGGWRQTLLAQRMGVPAALGLSVEEWQAQIGGYVRLSIPERRQAALELTLPVEQGGEGLSTREAAAVLGVDHATVARDVAPPRVASATPEPDDEAPTGAPAPGPVASATPEPDEPDEDPVGDYLAEADPGQDHRYVKAFLGSLRAAIQVVQFDPDRLGDLLDPDEVRTLTGHLASLAAFTDTITRRRTGLRIVPGRKS